MAKKRIEQLGVSPKNFTLKEIENGIEKLRRRIEELKVLGQSDGIHDSQKRKNAESNISDTILSVFGPQSSEFNEHQHHHIWHGPSFINMGEFAIRKSHEDGRIASITMLEGLIARLEEKKLDLSPSSS